MTDPVHGARQIEALKQRISELESALRNIIGVEDALDEAMIEMKPDYIPSISETRRIAEQALGKE